MNTKRQTIWLVSMLSLMVVLSAYYLFTEDVNKLNTATEKVTQEDIKVTTEQKDPAAGEKAVSSGLTSSSQTGDSKAAQGQSADANKSANTDAQVLEQVQNKAKSGSDYFADLAFKRNQDLGKRIEDLQNVMVDTKKSTDEISKASDDFDRLQTMQAKVENLEDLLGQTYNNAIVLEEGSKYKAVVQVAAKLEAKQAQGIIDMMIKELGVTKDAVSVQYLK
jgi:stage III sporulation protein AH